ncbi:hypothetical protein ALQ38_02379 [Pseudomonas marginalis pv. marginalis]|nr:hypothetical protein ALQ38_02379 [Pseudomonas marginalis pv. marginalis]
MTVYGIRHLCAAFAAGTSREYHGITARHQLGQSLCVKLKQVTRNGDGAERLEALGLFRMTV